MFQHRRVALLIGYIVSIIFSFLFCLFVTCIHAGTIEEITDATTMIEKQGWSTAPQATKAWRSIQEKRSYRWFLPLKNQAKLLSWTKPNLRLGCFANCYDYRHIFCPGYIGAISLPGYFVYYGINKWWWKDSMFSRSFDTLLCNIAK